MSRGLQYPTAEKQLSDDERILVNGFRKLNEKNKAKVESFLLGMLSKE